MPVSRPSVRDAVVESNGLCAFTPVRTTCFGTGWHTSEIFLPLAKLDHYLSPLCLAPFRNQGWTMPAPCKLPGDAAATSDPTSNFPSGIPSFAGSRFPLLLPP